MPSGPIGEEEAKKMRKRKKKKEASPPTELVADLKKRRKQGKESAVLALAESAQSPLRAIGLGGLEGLPAELKLRKKLRLSVNASKLKWLMCNTFKLSMTSLT